MGLFQLLTWIDEIYPYHTHPINFDGPDIATLIYLNSMSDLQKRADLLVFIDLMLYFLKIIIGLFSFIYLQTFKKSITKRIFVLLLAYLLFLVLLVALVNTSMSMLKIQLKPAFLIVYDNFPTLFIVGMILYHLFRQYNQYQSK